MISTNYLFEKLYFRTLTPIYIGQNQASDLSPYSDFVQIGNEIFYIDERKFEKELFSKEGLIDKYVNAVRQKIDKSKTKSDFELKSFIENYLGEVENFSRIKIPVDQDIKHQTIKRFINSSERPFIPGSTIKGAIRTAIIHHWLTETENGKKIVDELLKKIELLHQQKLELEKKKNESGLTEDEEDLLKKIKSKRNIENELNQIYNENKLFGDIRNNLYGFDSRNLKVSDSNLFSFKDISILKLQRIKIKDGLEISPIPCETLNANLDGNFDFKLEKRFVQNDLKSFNNYNIQNIFKIINAFSLASVKFEIESFDEEKYSECFKFYQDIENYINNNNNELAILRLGAGKTFYDNSIGLAIYNANKTTFKKYRELLELGKNPITHKLVVGKFPTTRTLVEATKLPIGWITISAEKSLIDSIKLYEPKILSVNKSDFHNKSVTESKKDTSSKRPPNTFVAEIIDDKSKPTKIKIIEGENSNIETIMPGVTISNLGLKKGSKVFVELLFQNKKVQKADYKGKAE